MNSYYGSQCGLILTVRLRLTDCCQLELTGSCGACAETFLGADLAPAFSGVYKPSLEEDR
jgi:hypothetical protein